ncbi:MAG TPA: proline--tRNA ligase [Candidatus Saccharimonadales bacterium]
MSQLFTKTSKNVPADETARNARLLIQAGFIHKEMAGVYSFLPLGLKVLSHITAIVRDEMDAIGGQELLMPALQVKERYEITGRWSDDVVDNWFKTKLVNGSELGLGFSHEENLVPILKNFVASYKDLPIAPYQIQTKFRNELRSKSGLMRGREFLMKDMYSFAISEAQHQDFYKKAQTAYQNIYDRLGIGERTVMVRASGGIFSKYSHEFQTFSDAGEDLIFQTSDGEYYNREVVAAKVAQANQTEEPASYQEVEGKDVIGVRALLKHLNIPIEKSTKTLLYTTDTGEVIVVAIRSDYEVNELKLLDTVVCKTLRLASEAEVKELTGAETGYAGLVNLPNGTSIFLDDSLEGLCNFETGANKTNYHAVNVNFGRDVAKPDKFYDFKLAREGDLDPATDKPMKTQKAIEVGNIFSLGTKFTEPFSLSVPNADGELITLIMGCYGLGVTRVMGTIAELLSDERGLVWPAAVAPAQVYLARLGDNPDAVKQADELYNRLTAAGVGVLYDDRSLRPGEKFADADLLGIPYRVVVSDKTAAEDNYELKARQSDDSRHISFKELLEILGTPG